MERAMIAKPQFDGTQMRPDAQVVEALGRNLLVTELLRANLEVAFPIRDRGIDLIAYLDTGDGVRDFVACPIQMKAASRESFSIDKKYEPFPGLILAYVWNVFDPDATVTYALTYGEAVEVADHMGYTQNDAWLVGRRWNCPTIGRPLRKLLEPHRMTCAKWREKIARFPFSHSDQDH
jgi:hypothetical protein